VGTIDESGFDRILNDKRRAILVFVVTKNTLVLLRIAFGQAFLEGCAIAGAKAQFSYLPLRPD
jgi:hypothetical protein